MIRISIILDYLSTLNSVQTFTLIFLTMLNNDFYNVLVFFCYFQQK